MRSLKNLFLAVPALLSLAACGTALNGVGQSITIETVPAKSASCLIENSRGAWNVQRTPSSVALDRARGDLTVSCNTMDGWSGSTTVKSTAQAVPLVGAVGIGAATGGALGMANAGGNAAAAVGFTASVTAPQIALAAGGAALGSAAIDAHTGALWRYPEKVIVRLSPAVETNEVPDAMARAVARVAPAPAPEAAPSTVRRRAPSLRSRAPEVTK